MVVHDQLRDSATLEEKIEYLLSKTVQDTIAHQLASLASGSTLCMLRWHSSLTDTLVGRTYNRVEG